MILFFLFLNGKTSKLATEYVHNVTRTDLDTKLLQLSLQYIL